MRVLIATHGYPPELRGGTELQGQALARAAAARGLDVAVVAGSLEHGKEFGVSRSRDRDHEGGAEVIVHRLHRADLYFDHWQKHASSPVSGAFRGVIESFRPDVVHVLHWLRLSSDLVRVAARAGVPAVVSLNDHLTSCLLTQRVHPGERAACARVHSHRDCLSCAAQVPPRTPWVPTEQLYMAFSERRQAFARELALARYVLVPSLAHGEALARGLVDGDFSAQVMPPLRTVSLRARRPIADPGPTGPLLLGAWGLGSPIKGARLLHDALAMPALQGRARLHIAGPAVGVDGAPSDDVEQSAEFDPLELQSHPVSKVHALVVSSLAPESYCIVADEGLELGLPLLLPDTPALRERFEEGQGALFYAQGDPTALAACAARLLDEPRLLAELRSRAPSPAAVTVSPAAILEFHLELWGKAVLAGPPSPEQVGQEDWFEARMRDHAMEQWDAACAQASAEELGLDTQ